MLLLLLVSPISRPDGILAIFQLFRYIPVRIDFENIEVREGATILAAIFNNLLGIISRPVSYTHLTLPTNREV